MDDLISRQAAIDALCKMHCGCTISDCPLNYEEDGAEECADVRWLMGLPSAQPEIIRCKDCKYWFDIDAGRQKHRMCADLFGEWFCADAERRE